MSENDVQSMLVSYLRDTHAMEENVLTMLDGLIATTSDDVMRDRLQQHRTETEGQIRLLDQRLEAHDAKTGASVKDVPAKLGAYAKGLIDIVRSDKPGKNARDGYVTEHLEIAAYQLLERLATKAGDEQTAEVARTIRAQEQEMARFIDENWDRVITLTLAEEGVTV